MSFRAPIHVRDRQNSPGPSVLGSQMWCSVEVAHQVCCFSQITSRRWRRLFAHLCGAVQKGKSPFYQVYYLARDVLPLMDLKA